MRKIAPVCLLALLVALAAPPARAVVPGTNTQVEATGNGSTTVFPFTFKATSSSWVKVYVNEVEQTSGYTVALSPNQDAAAGGAVTFLVAPASGAAVRVRRTIPLTQELALRDGDRLPAKSLERTFDRLAMVDQQLDRRIGEAEAVQGAVNGEAVVTANGSSTGRQLKARFADVVNVKDYGAIGDGIADDTAAIQAALTAAGTGGRHVFLPSGTYLVDPGIQIPTAMFIHGAGPIATTIKARSAGTGSPPTYTAGAGGQTYSQTLSFWPVLYNTSPLWGWEIADLTIDGGGFNVYGLRLSENYYGSLRNVRVTGCAQRPYVNIRGQAIVHQDFIVYDNSAGALLFNVTAVSFIAGGFERLGGDFFLQVRQPAAAFNKGTVTLSGVWFEGAAGKTPTTAMLGFGGRGVSGRSLFFTLGDTFTSQAGLYALPQGDALTVDGVNMAAAAAQGASLEQVNYTDTMATYLGTGTTATLFAGQLNSTNTTDASGNTSNTVRFVGSGIDWPYVHGRWQARRAFTSGASVAATAYNVDVQDDVVSFFESANNFLKKNSGILELGANSTLRLLSGTTSGQNVVVQNRSGTSDYASGHLVMGANHIWFESSGGRVFTKNASPSSATDGTPLSRFVGVPASATATGAPGDWSADATWLYVCHATNTWKRVGIAAW